MWPLNLCQCESRYVRDETDKKKQKKPSMIKCIISWSSLNFPRVFQTEDFFFFFLSFPPTKDKIGFECWFLFFVFFKSKMKMVNFEELVICQNWDKELKPFVVKRSIYGMSCETSTSIFTGSKKKGGGSFSHVEWYSTDF